MRREYGSHESAWRRLKERRRPRLRLAYPFCQAIYQVAGAVERFFAWLKGFRRLALG